MPPIRFRPFNTPQDYQNARYNFIKSVEGEEVRPYYDSDGLATIGAGFNMGPGGNPDVQRIALNAILYPTLIDPNDIAEFEAQDTPYRTRILARLRERRPANMTGDTLAAENLDLQNDLNAIMAARANNTGHTYPARRPTFAFDNEDEVMSAFDRMAVGYEDTVDQWSRNFDPPLAAPIPDSQERVALFSLAWNQSAVNPLLGPGLAAAIATGDRAEAWYEIRYGSNGDRLPGIAKRRYYEAEYFGLYTHTEQLGETFEDTPENDKEARDVFRMHQKHKAKILKYDNDYGDTDLQTPHAKNPCGRDMICNANNDFEGRTVEIHYRNDAYMPAWRFLAAKYGIDNDPATDLEAARMVIDFAPEKNTINLSTNTGNTLLMGGDNADKLTTGNGNDVLTGDDGNDELNGGAGDDRVYGGAGNDTPKGGEGNDVLVAGVGVTLQDHGPSTDLNDRMEGGNGNDRYIWAPNGDGDVQHIADTDGVGSISYLGNGHYPPNPGAVPDLSPGKNLDGDYFLNADGTLTTGPRGESGRVLRLQGGNLEIEYGFGTPLHTMIVENFPSTGALGINVLKGECRDMTNALPPYEMTCGNDVAPLDDATSYTVDMKEGNDWFRGQATTGNNVITLGSGADKAETGSGNDWVDGGPGNDVISVREGVNTVLGGTGDDQISGEGADQLHGGPGNDEISGVGSNSHLMGEEGDDYLVLWRQGRDPIPSTATSLLEGGPGNDILEARTTATLEGGPGVNRFIVDGEALTAGAVITIRNSSGKESPSSIVYIRQSGAGYVPLQQAAKNGTVTKTYDENTKVLTVKTKASLSAADAQQDAALADSAGSIVIEEFYNGMFGLDGVANAPPPPWQGTPGDPPPEEPITPTVPITYPVYLPLIQAKVQTEDANVQGVAAVDTRHPLEIEHPEYVAYVAVPDASYPAMPGVAAGMLYGGAAMTAALPDGVKRPIHDAINDLQTEIDVAQYHADKAIEKAKGWLRERVGHGRD